ncbi:hypothetical protein [Mycolicibacterium sp. lyk4-40-TYG-92]|uniref:hypothetical protein n=1 Tax=Mycolicibacterium sp. lyk4-40-TYG-92 TaxID=3040295 RepID=UPI00254BCE72|nr:hypothetical protein [Mycolicibacterium sp. lyk4-40-TYG-92]
MSHNTLVLAVTGRVSGTIYQVPVSYSIEGSELVCFTDAPWWKNLRRRAPVTARVDGRSRAGTALAVTGPIVTEHLARHLRVVPRDARYHAVRLGPGNEPHLGDLERAALSTAMIRVRLSER